MTDNDQTRSAEAAFGAGCFWGVEELFRTTPGVTETEAGYMGGEKENPTYDEVSSHTTGHAETVHITFDPDKITYNQLLDIFWQNHNPTTLNRQGPDVGEQYRSVIFYFTDEQKTVAEKSKQNLEQSGKFSRPIVTQIVPATHFYRAEEYHQKYLQKHGLDVCQL